MTDMNRTKANDSIEYPGVYKAVKKNGSVYYRSSFTYKNKHISLGSFDDPDDAHRVYTTANLLVASSSVHIEDYSTNQLIPFDKWVVIINFRDNDIYFTTPIYMRKNYFSYFLSPSEELKFSIDDLFYYSSHKIMKRGGHLFVADYGMQVSIVSRYGIRPYAVEGRDYVHLNGDLLDFRYENIKVDNIYHGVRLTHKGHRQLYQALIHIKGNYVIGYYDDAVKAAIAYNKAIDVLHSNGLNKAYIPNYIESISASAYADIYSSIIIPEKLASYRPDEQSAE